MRQKRVQSGRCDPAVQRTMKMQFTFTVAADVEDNIQQITAMKVYLDNVVVATQLDRPFAPT